MATLLFLGASVSQLPAIRYAHEAGHRVVAVDGDPGAVAFGHADVARAVDFTDVDRVTDVAREFGVEGVLAISTDRAVPPAAEVAARLGLPGIGVDVARAMTDKATMRACLAAGGVPQPGHAVLTEETDLATACAAISFPAVLKPVDSGGQRGVFRAGSLEEVERLLPDVLRFSRSGRAVIEEYVEGGELNGILVVRGGEPVLITLSDRLRPGGVAFGVGWIHSFPSSLGSEVLQEVRTVAFAAVRALGLRDGIAFPQLIAAERGTVQVVEVAARIAAGQMADLVSFGTGVNLFEIAIRQSLGQPIPDALVTPAFTRPIAIRFLTASPGVLPVGTVTAIEGLDEVRAATGVLAADVYFRPGATIGPLQVDADRSGYVVATGDSPSAALELADSASRKLVVRTAPTDDGARRRRASRPRLIRLAPILVVLVLVFGTGVGLVLTENVKLQRALVLGTRVDKQFSPICSCAHDVAHMTFRLLRAGTVTVQMVNAIGRPVTTFLRNKIVPAGSEHFRWNGRSASGHVLPDGVYRPQVAFPSLDRTLRLPSPIVLDTKRPQLFRIAMQAARGHLLVRYAFGEPAHALLLVDGHRAVLTRSVTPDGRLAWYGLFPDGRRIRPGEHRISLTAIDLAGNRALPSKVHEVKLA